MRLCYRYAHTAGPITGMLTRTGIGTSNVNAIQDSVNHRY
jgi:hypothetical protein